MLRFWDGITAFRGRSWETAPHVVTLGEIGVGQLRRAVDKWMESYLHVVVSWWEAMCFCFSLQGMMT